MAGGDTFLDVIGAEGAPVRPSTRLGPVRHRRDGARSLVAALVPPVAMLAALAAIALAGLSRRSGVPALLDDYAYGYFLSRYPLFAFALIYAGARIVVGAIGPGTGGLTRRALVSLAGLAILAVAGLYPTFGGLTLRGGFAVGGMTFLTGQPLWLAYGLGAATSAAMMGSIVGGTIVLANRPLRPSWARFGRGFVSFLCLWFGAAVIGLARDQGFGPWPTRAMLPAEAVFAAGLLVVAAAPHILHVALQSRRSVS